MKFKHIILCLIILLVAGSAFSSDRQPRYLEMTFVTTNDLHGHLWPFDAGADASKKFPGAKNIGGAPRRATAIDRIRAEMRTPVLVCDVGDTTFSQTVLGNAYRGAADIAVMNEIGYDVMAPGNHEFNLHAPEILRNKRDSRFPWVCANMVYEKTGELFAEPYVIREVDGVRVAFFGLMNDLPNRQPDYYIGAPELGLKVTDAAEAAKQLVPELRKKAEIVVLLSHLGVGPDVALAKAVPGIDVMLGAHSHTILQAPVMVRVSEPSAYSLGAVPVQQGGYHGIWTGRTRVVFHRGDDGRYTLMSCKGELVYMDSAIPADAGIEGMLHNWTDRIPNPK